MISEDCFNKLSASELKVDIDGMGIEGKIQMNKLLMAPNFKLAFRLPMIKTVVIESLASKMTAQERKEQELKSKKGRKSEAQRKAEKE